MLLYIVRHAWAGRADDAEYPDDSLRPLTDEGRRRFKRFIRRLHALGFAPSQVFSSPLVRCHQTARVIEKRCGAPLSLKVELAPGGNWEDLLSESNTSGVNELAWVGHSPDVEAMIASLAGDGAARVQVPKGTVVAIEFEGDIHLGQGTLLWLLPPKLLGI